VFCASFTRANGGSWRTVPGQAFYEKIPVTSAGLDLTHPVMTPIRNARVEVIDPDTGSVLSVSQTGQSGNFQVTAPVQSNCRVRVLSRMRDANVLVVDNTNSNSLYAAVSDLAPGDTNSLVIARDSNRVSGAFNILEMLREGREMARYADPSQIVPDITVFWSPLNSPNPGAAKESLGATYFDPRTKTISLIGDRSIDSDEFDDSVILHEFGHFLASAFSRDSSPGGVHLLGDALDPRLAWSEGWANFFSSAVRNNPIFLDSYGPAGSKVLRFDLRDATPDGDKPGYWSEFSVHSILWDLFGDKSGDADSVPQPIQTIWSAFTVLKQDRQVYLPYFLQHLAEHPELTTVVSTMAQSRSIDFHPDRKPNVSNPFPKSFAIGDVVTGTLDSYSTQRKELLQSSDFWTFHAPGGPMSLRLDITGLGPGNNPDTNDLDLFLFALDGTLVDFADQGFNGESQLLVVSVPPGDYMVEVRSYYGRADTGETVFNSATYQLIVRTPTP